jgi:hypothetical protein
LKLFDGTNNITDLQLEQLFSPKKTTEMDIVLRTVELLLYENYNSTNIVEIYKLLGLENFSKLVQLFDGRTIKLPTKQELTDNLISSLVYYYRNIQNESWEEVKAHFPFEISGIKHGIQVKHLNTFIQQKLEETLRKLDNNGENK